MVFEGKIIKSLFKKIFSDRVVFKDGSYIEYLNREGILYVENNHRLEIVWFFNSGVSMKGRVLPAAINFKNWDPPNDREPISKVKYLEILEKINIYCNRRNIPFKVEAE